MAVPDNYLIAGLSITGHFEDAREPLAGVTGNFDGMGISLGVLQWNIGSNSLQPIVKALGRDVCTSTMPHLGDDLWKACNAPVAQGLAVVRAWQPANALPNSVRDELRAFVKSRQFQDLQLKTAHAVGDQAWNTASDWAQKQGRTSPTKREFCWFYDVFTQNGSLKSVTPATVQAFIDNHGAAQADDLVCDWLAARTDDKPGAVDSRKNAILWRNAVADANLFLFVASFLRTAEANPLWQSDVMNRKGTIAVGTGWVHSGEHDLTPITG
jgi:hypothetical protein